MTLAIVTPSLPAERLSDMLGKVQVGAREWVAPRDVSDIELSRYHTPEYVRALRDGWSEEWSGRRPELADAHIRTAGGTLRLAERVWRGHVRRGLSPHGLRTLPAPDQSVWGETVNDAALAAGWLTRRGLRVSLVDIGRPRDMFEMPGLQVVSTNHPVFESDDELLAFLEIACDVVRSFAPDVVLYAASTCHLEEDPTTDSGLTLSAYSCGAKRVAQLADEVCSGRVIAGCGTGHEAAGDWAVAAMAATAMGLIVSADTHPERSAEPASESEISRGGLRLIRGGAS